MAGLAALGGGAILIISERRRKFEKTHNTQTGIDPSQLRATSTSTGSGGYKTNRGEAELINSDYAKTRSVYEQGQIEKKVETVQPEPEPEPEPTQESTQDDEKEKLKEELRKTLEELKKELKKQK